MNKLKVVKVDSEYIEFENGLQLSSKHDQECCETHYLDFTALSLDDFIDLEFDLSGDKFFKKIEGYGIELIPIKGYSVKIAGYGDNNGYYSSNLTLLLTDWKQFKREFDIDECQTITG